ncbi:DUF2501 domain-containing protein [Sphingomonas sp. BAUL-RG-20F-R05-02]|uniref:DUF2501 domain-containing protein n=1 Tax=Sphingomonas sp. BAUL-RG-20F-R05-02 TaxID=2914830 RepID=UPI001F5A628B|nr:DUF2501 domain-containing protein [Sphingomonas sp. BAUL-RG-20F-R05-02]
MMRALILSTLPFILSGTAVAQTQSQPDVPSGKGLLGGLGGLGNLGSGLSGLTSGLNLNAVGKSNAVGLLSYCVKNKLLRQQQNVAGGLIGKLTGQEPAVESTRGFLDDQKGLLQQRGGNRLSLDALPSGIKSKACDLVLSKAQSFL